MRKRFTFIIILLLMGSLLISCSTSPHVTVTHAGDLERAVQAQKVVVVSDTGKCNGIHFRDDFIDEIAKLTQGSQKRISIMTDVEYISSPYARPEVNKSLPDTLYVFVNFLGSEPGEYGTYTVKYLIEVKYLNQAPFLSEEITLGIGNPAFEAPSLRAEEFAQTVFKELNTRNIL